jgi:membrane protease subunit HflK
MTWDWEKLQSQRRRHEGPPPPPQMDDIIRKFRSFKDRMPSIGIIIIISIVLYALSTMFYTVGVDEVGVVQRFGKFVRIVQPGLNFKLPKGIEKVTKVKVKYVYKEEFGFRTIRAGIRTKYASGSAFLNESLMLTGDLNVAVVPWTVQYRIKDPYEYLFKVRNVRATLRDLSEATMRLVVGDRSINEVISKRQEIALQAKELLQKELNRAHTGIKVVTIELKKTNVPEPVQPSFNEVNEAIQEKEQMIYKAREEYNKVIPQAKGEAEKTIRKAEGYALERINMAKGDAARFNQLYAEYTKAKEITKKRLYLEALRDIFSKIGTKYIVDEDQKNLLPLLNLGKSEGSNK